MATTLRTEQWPAKETNKQFMGIFKKKIVPLKHITKSASQKKEKPAHFLEHAVQVLLS